MAIAAFSVSPDSPEDFAVWSGAHAAHHRDLARVLFETDGTVLPDFLLDPFDPSDPAAAASWAYQHQVMHDAISAALGIAGFNLQGVDWGNRQSLHVFIAQNLSEHFQAGTILGVM